jgi:preprotein translocase subunit SecD
MKNLLYQIIGFSFVLLSLCDQNSYSQNKTVVLQADNVSTVLLNQAGNIISARLKYIGLTTFNLSVVADRGQIRVQLPDNIQLSEVEGILTSRGELLFKDDSGKTILSRKDIESMNSSKEKDSESFKIDIKFNQAASLIWAKATRENLNRSISVVVDNKVLWTPVVRVPIENGLCELTGNFTQKELNYFLAIINNEQMPVSLSIVH